MRIEEASGSALMRLLWWGHFCWCIILSSPRRRPGSETVTSVGGEPGMYNIIIKKLELQLGSS